MPAAGSTGRCVSFSPRDHFAHHWYYYHVRVITPAADYLPLYTCRLLFCHSAVLLCSYLGGVFIYPCITSVSATTIFIRTGFGIVRPKLFILTAVRYVRILMFCKVLLLFSPRFAIFCEPLYTCQAAVYHLLSFRRGSTIVFAPLFTCKRYLVALFVFATV